jgi:hypothetical protein
MVALGYSGWASAMMTTAATSEQTRDLANAGHVPVATLAEDVDLVQPQAINVGSTTATLPAPKAEQMDRGKLTAAAYRARKAYPGPVGVEISDLLTAWAEFGFRLGGHSRIAKLVAAVMAIPFEELDLPPAA